MTTFRIRNAISKATLGVFEAGTTTQALDQLAQAGGWDGFAALTREVPLAAGGVIVERLSEGTSAHAGMRKAFQGGGNQLNATPTSSR